MDAYSRSARPRRPRGRHALLIEYHLASNAGVPPCNIPAPGREYHRLASIVFLNTQPPVRITLLRGACERKAPPLLQSALTAVEALTRTATAAALVVGGAFTFTLGVRH